MKPKTLKVVYYDGAITYGGALVVLRHLFNAIDRQHVTPRLISCAPPCDLKNFFDPADIALIQSSTLNYATRKKFMKKFSPSNRWLKRFIAYGYSIAEWVLNLPSNIRLLITIAGEKPDLIHVNNNTLPLWIARCLKIPVVWHIHVIPQKPGPVVAQLMKSVDTYIAISQYVADAAVAAGYESDKVITIANPMPKTIPDPTAAARVKQRYNIDENSIVIAHAGRLIPWKGQLEFLRAFKAVIAIHPNAVALIVGDDQENISGGYQQRLKEYAEAHLPANAVIFTGQINNVIEIMQAADLVAHSSISPEPFGLVITEAMSAGTPIVASSLGSPNDIVDNGINGFTVDVSDSHQFGERLNQLIADSALRRELSINALRDIETRYCPKIYAKHITDAYLKTLTHY
jgi:glycosyltransferase involved in cell wall biosynthesis